MFQGKVIHGDGMGNGQGYPTACIDVTHEQMDIDPGVYAAEAYVGEKKYEAALMAQHDPLKVEVFLFDYEGPSLYGAELKVHPLVKVSEFKALDDPGELVEKIEQDISIIRAYFH